MPKTVFIAHPIAGDVNGNMKKVLKICQMVHAKEIIPVAPYLVALQYLNDEVVEDRALGTEANLECFHRRYIDELWLYGNRISEGMKGEIRVAVKYHVSVIPKTDETKGDLEKFCAEEWFREAPLGWSQYIKES